MYVTAAAFAAFFRVGAGVTWNWKKEGVVTESDTLF